MRAVADRHIRHDGWILRRGTFPPAAVDRFGP